MNTCVEKLNVYEKFFFGFVYVPLFVKTIKPVCVFVILLICATAR